MVSSKEHHKFQLEANRIVWRQSVLASTGGVDFLLKHVKSKEQDVSEHRLGHLWLKHD